MSVLFVEPSTSLIQALGYLAEQSHNPDQCPDRNLMVDSNYSDVSEFFAETERRIAKANRLRNHLYSVRLSFKQMESLGYFIHISMFVTLDLMGKAFPRAYQR